MQKTISSSETNATRPTKASARTGKIVIGAVLATSLLATSGCVITREKTFTPVVSMRPSAQAGQPEVLTTNMVETTKTRVEPLVLFGPIYDPFVPVLYPEGVVILRGPGPYHRFMR